jgi:HEAT repeat protein
MKRLFLIAVVAVILGGCSKPAAPLAGGKPVSHWVQTLQEPDANLRKTAVFKLGNVGATDPVVLPALLGMLKDQDAGVRREAILALMKCGSSATEAIPTLTELQQHDFDEKIRAFAGRALHKLQSKP